MTKKKDETIKSLAINSKDVGSAEVQIGLLSKKIEKLSLETVIKIEGKGKEFDSKLHEAIGAIENDECETEKIIEIVREGYLLNGEVLRTAKVIVSKRKEGEE